METSASSKPGPRHCPTRPTALAHCDTLDGPVVMAAKAALEKGDVTPVLRWVKKDQEDQIKAAFKKTVAVLAKGGESKELADMYFFETLVRVHRAGEGAPYTGLKPGGQVEPAVQMADKALETGSPKELLKELSEAVHAGLHKRFVKAVEAKKQADKSVELGREFVEAYVDYVHWAEHMFLIASGGASHHGDEGKVAPEGGHHH